MSETSSITAAESEKPRASRKRDVEFWFADGTIVLIIQETEFRVYRGLLEDRFPIFKDLLSLPQPAPAADALDGDDDDHCPVVHLCDSARDWRNVFRLYMPRRDISLFDQGPSRPSFEMLSACVRLGHKYDMTHMEHEALDYLKILFHPPLYRPTIRWPPQGFLPSSAIGVVNLARLTGEHSLLPVALFHCCRLDAEVTEGFAYSDGEREMLSAEDLGRCFVARSKLMQETYGKYTRSFMAASDPARPRKKPCRAANNACRSTAAGQKFFAVANSTADSFEHAYPFVHLEVDLPDDVKRTMFCDACWEVYRKCEEEEHKALWKRLPTIFGVDLLNISNPSSVDPRILNLTRHVRTLAGAIHPHGERQASACILDNPRHQTYLANGQRALLTMLAQMFSKSSVSPGLGSSGLVTLEPDKASRTRDKDFWFEDGTIILVAGNTEFRVYRGHLARRCDVFKDMLSFPQPASTAVCTRDGEDHWCPIIHVTDSARDWRHVLRLMLNAEEQGLFSKHRPDPSFEVVSACVRLGHKYQMTSIYEQAMRYLKLFFTDSLDTFRETPTFIPPAFQSKHAIGVVNLAHLTQEPTMLPVAMWMCCRLGANILDGFMYSDGERETLSSEDLRLCLNANAELLKFTILAILRTYAPLPPGCCKLEAGNDRCQEVFHQLSETAGQVAHITTMPNPVMLFDVSHVDAPGLCKGCSAAVRERREKRQRENWKQLPSMLGIAGDVPGW
ncbi:hypothetical protein L226DRAFT_614693 [Lentinus tigrinus ALCF2SS1-7]|uniref:BTB domain-containing protein n=1 Tax=Lentinus tigrinus ALCF2SS1-6 TaxID=1328759 RepID=A0A5C2S616_9APHY|nr:hypothetical protein L227DRAFT_654613 [Lentinus tigrinus ALCF2SS1-6]RPD72841.1 hypothetical protein L226DRAFT_614693 [Lentinus tigrinus ALCF2SS1-7]